MGSYLDIIYCIILFAFTIYNAKVIYRNYKHGQSLGTGYIAIFKIKAHTRKNETNPGNRKQLLHEKHPE